MHIALLGLGHNKQIDPQIGTMAGRKKPPKYDNNGNQLRGKQFKMNHTRTQSSDDGVSIVCHNSASIVNRTHHSYAIIGPFMGFEFDCCGYQSDIKAVGISL